jgi:hypothetical protein
LEEILIPLLSLVDNFIFSGVPSNLVYDLIKTAWQKANEKTWDDLYFDSFRNAMREMQPILARYGDSPPEFDDTALDLVLRQNLSVDIGQMSFLDLTRKEFVSMLVKSLKKRQALMIGGHNLTDLDYEQLLSRFIDYAQSSFKESIIQNENAFRKEILTETWSNSLLMEKIQDYLRLHHDVVIHDLNEIKEAICKQDVKLAEMHSDINTIKQHLGIDRTRNSILNELNSTLDHLKKGQIFTQGLCTGYLLHPWPDRYFLAQEFNQNSDDLRQALSDSLSEFSMRPIRADEFVENGHILCKISGLIQMTSFGVYQLTKSQNRNVYLELGIALGLGRPFILVKERDADVASIIDGLDYISINHYLGLKYNLAGKVEKFLADLANFKYRELDHDDVIPNSVVVSHGGMDVIDFTVPIAKAIFEHRCFPVILGDPTSELPKYLEYEGVKNYFIVGETGSIELNETIGVIRSAKCGVYRVDKNCSANGFLALGVALGVNSPGILTHDINAALPTDVKGLASIPFRSYKQMMEKIPSALQRCIDRISV